MGEGRNTDITSIVERIRRSVKVDGLPLTTHDAADTVQLIEKLQSELAELNKDYKLLVEIHDKDFKQVLKLDQELSKSRELVGRLSDLLDRTVRTLENTDNLSGTCCCGEPMNGHSGYYTGDHTPTDSGAYHASNLLTEIRAALELIGGKKNEAK